MNHVEYGIWDTGYGIRDVGMWECGNVRPDARDSKKDEDLIKKKKKHSATLPLCNSTSVAHITHICKWLDWA